MDPDSKLRDNLGRIHDYLRISLTEKCNLRCTYCMPAEGIALRNRSLFMTKDEVVSIAKTFVSLGVKKIRLTGGEPLVCKDAADIIIRLSKLPVHLAVTTNGILVNEYIDTFQKAGIKSVNVSLDSLNNERFFSITRRNEFQKVFANIQLLLYHGFTVKVNMVVMRGINDHEVPDFIELAKDFPLHLRFIEFMPFTGNRWKSTRVLAMDEILNLIESKFAIIKLNDERHDTAKKYKVVGHQGTFAVISTMSDPFCGDCNRLRLTADGKMKNCLFSREETDLLTPLRNGADVKERIIQCVLDKKEKQGGQFENKVPDADRIKNRSMVTIGG